ncbi:MAG: L-histidine N(alpha)-methyltransferase [Candidatus Aminicenantes bacterium]|nr:MAG: L-histidine N(alpha)-methyltransferase [Candidatus Aminicenantes bacterium]
MNLQTNIINYFEHQTLDLVDRFAQDVEQGLSCKNKKLPCMYIYDDEGTRLFREIMALPEYYLTQCEIEILQQYKDFLGDLFKEKNFCLFELGAGDGQKTRILLDHFQKRGIDFHYIPIDISALAIESLIKKLSEDCSGLQTTGLVSEYFQGLKYVSRIDVRTKVVLFLGSNIGNMDPDQSHEFLRGVHDSLEDGDYLLIGFDLKKDAEILTRAYNDAAGITAQFNKNVLLRINTELGGTFNLDHFAYHSVYDPQAGAIKSYLISTENQEVYISAIDSLIKFEKWEAIHTESAYKYDEAEIEKMAARSGFIIKKNLYDPWRFFTDSLWQVKKG